MESDGSLPCSQEGATGKKRNPMLSRFHFMILILKYNKSLKSKSLYEISMHQFVSFTFRG
jgi:hypothetical protein